MKKAVLFASLMLASTISAGSQAQVRWNPHPLQPVESSDTSVAFAPVPNEPRTLTKVEHWFAIGAGAVVGVAVFDLVVPITIAVIPGALSGADFGDKFFQ